MSFPTSLDTIVDGTTTIVAAHVLNLENVLVGPVWYNVLSSQFGAKKDQQSVTDGAITSGLTALTSATGRFVAADVGKAVSVSGAGAAGAPLTTTIAAFVSSTQVTVALAASTTVTNKNIQWATPDDPAINSAITAASNAGGGVVFLPAGVYSTTASIVLKSGVRLQGEQCPLGWTFADTFIGTSIQPFGTIAYDAVKGGSGAYTKFWGLSDIAIQADTDATHWAFRAGPCVGMILRNVSVLQGATGANGYLLDGGVGTQGVLQSSIENIAANCGNGFTGGTGIQLGDSVAGGIASTIYGHNILAQGYTTGVDFNNGAGNILAEVWVQSNTTGIKFGVQEASVVLGGWQESLTTGVAFGANAFYCGTAYMRKIGTVTTPYTDVTAANGNFIRDQDSVNYGTHFGTVGVNGAGAKTGLDIKHNGTSAGDTIGINLTSAGGLATIVADAPGGGLANIVLTPKAGSAVKFSGHLTSTDSAAPTTTNKGANVTSVTFTGNDTRGSIAIVMAGVLAANTRIATCTYAAAYAATPGVVMLVNETSGVGLAVKDFYVGAEAAGSFDLFCNQALAAGTETLKYIVIG